ncbi:MAG: MBL fold metallo-hydrolase [Rhodospirillales bacterium CG15_BIG_FIL_POST_REV_8_21_14_020_66_15]|nr:MAG: MBL fold metallo-hydrolase [Rhodospirillales bacterium CG15_BIG_FIL_POST_REV_8_21_14_020_66_15]
MKLTFMGATGTVTGSKYLVEAAGAKVLVDCGLFQGLKDLRLRNWAKLPVDPASIDAVILTHAHLDHSGYIPLLVKNGFKGPVYCSAATRDLCAILLPDSGYLQEADAERANRYTYTRHKPALPLYTQKDAERSLGQFHAVPFGQPQVVGDGGTFVLSRSGHILGSAFVRIADGRTSLVFSGDLGRAQDPVMKPPAEIHDADFLVLESTYGDRLHRDSDPEAKLGAIIRDTAARGGTVVIPSFAVGRTQSVLFHIHRLKKSDAIPDIPIFLDSPMAIDATILLRRHRDDHRLSGPLCAEVCHAARYVNTPEESCSLDDGPGVPQVIISASGMATGGRVLHHLKHFIGDARNTVLFTGFQAAGTRGARLVHGEDEIKIHGRMWPVRAEISVLHNMSAHADYGEILGWLRHFRTPPRRTFITHGEPEAATSLRMKIQDRLGWDVVVPEYLETVDL